MTLTPRPASTAVGACVEHRRHQALPDPRRRAAAHVGHVHAVDGVDLDRRRPANRRAGGRVGLGQVDRRPARCCACST